MSHLTVRWLLIVAAVSILSYLAGRLLPNDQHREVIICGNLDDRPCGVWDDITIWFTDTLVDRT